MDFNIIAIVYKVMLLSVSLFRCGFFMCTSPISIKRVYAGRVKVDVLPCGHCAECLKKKQNGYVCRCIEEAKKLGRVWFVTLTYSQENCPKICVDNLEYLSLRREDVKKWKREVRRSYLKTYGVPFPKFSFILCGEYGSRTSRPHYHGFFCGLDLKHAQILEKYWQEHFGFTVFKSIPLLPSSHDDISAVARYVSKYVCKPFKVPFKLKGIVEEPRIMSSVGFGLPDDFDRFKKHILNGVELSAKRFSTAQLSIINDRCKYTYNGVEYGLPLYYRRKIFYEKNYKGNLQASPLSKLCSSSLRDHTFEDMCRELRNMESSLSEREISETIATAVENEGLSLVSRQRVAEKDLQSPYRKDKF